MKRAAGAPTLNGRDQSLGGDAIASARDRRQITTFLTNKNLDWPPRRAARDAGDAAVARCDLLPEHYVPQDEEGLVGGGTGTDVNVWAAG